MTNRFDRYLNVNNHSSIDLPYVTLFDPDKESSYAIARDLIEAGAPGLILRQLPDVSYSQRLEGSKKTINA